MYFPRNPGNPDRCRNFRGSPSFPFLLETRKRMGIYMRPADFGAFRTLRVSPESFARDIEGLAATSTGAFTS